VSNFSLPTHAIFCLVYIVFRLLPLPKPVVPLSACWCYLLHAYPYQKGKGTSAEAVVFIDHVGV